MTIESFDPAEERSFDVYSDLRLQAGNDLWAVSDLAEYLGVNVRTLRAQAKSHRIPEPTLRARSAKGNLTLQLYTRAECLLIQQYYLDTDRPIIRKINKNKPLGEQKW